ncbi:hypothetical protein HYT01_04260 [Candidatus Giovannonibacteria bacterium]|nr:hypothetical protein [Candidatus Giovannonibacteria bacterium]
MTPSGMENKHISELRDNGITFFISPGKEFRIGQNFWLVVSKNRVVRAHASALVETSAGTLVTLTTSSFAAGEEGASEISKTAPQDNDIAIRSMSRFELMALVRNIKLSIRGHMHNGGRKRTWLDDALLYKSTLPEEETPRTFFLREAPETLEPPDFCI